MLEKICTDLTTSRKIEKLGIGKETEFYYSLGGTLLHNDLWIPSHSTFAYTLEQIIDKLPESIQLDSDSLAIYYFTLEHGEVCYENGRQDHSYDTTHTIERGTDNLATCAAKLLIRLIEDKIITVEEVNNG